MKKQSPQQIEKRIISACKYVQARGIQIVKNNWIQEADKEFGTQCGVCALTAVILKEGRRADASKQPTRVHLLERLRRLEKADQNGVDFSEVAGKILGIKVEEADEITTGFDRNKAISTFNRVGRAVAASARRERADHES